MNKKYKTLLTLKKYLAHHKKGLIWGFFALILTQVFTVMSPKIMGLAIDSLRENPEKSVLLKYALLFIGVMIAQGIFRFFMRYVIIGISRKIEYKIRNEYFSRLLKLSQNFYNRVRTGDLMARATNDLNAVRAMLGPGILYSINTVFLFIVVAAIMFTINVKLTLLALVPFPFIAFIVYMIGKRIHKLFEKIQEQFSTIETRVQEVLSGIRVIKSYNRGENELKIFKNLNAEYVSRNKKLIKLWSLFFPLMQLLGGIGMSIILIFGGYQVINKIITLGDFVAYTGYLMMLLWPMMALGWVINLFQRGAASLGRINSIIDEEPDIRDNENIVEIKDIKGEIEVKNLTFNFPGTDKSVLKNISFKISQGKSLAVIGRTGSGKTTLINVLSRVLDPPDDTVFIDGVDIKRLSLKNLREIIGLVPQEPFLFSDTITENIRFAKSDAAMDEIVSASEVGAVDKDIEQFSDKYESLLGERGINLSGGQKQRLTISRAVIKNPKIFLFDDALSSVDTATEEKILSNFKKIKGNKTCILIAHRISTIRDCDYVIVLKEGEIIEEGTHEDLLQLQGHYTELYNKQLITEELENI
ncbi:ABC transporter ATP-binding protein [candidate division KSB1 bacterium]